MNREMSQLRFSGYFRCLLLHKLLYKKKKKTEKKTEKKIRTTDRSGYFGAPNSKADYTLASELGEKK